MSWFTATKPIDIAPAQIKRNELAQNYRAMLATPQGQAVLADLVKFSQDCEDHARARGRSDVMLRMLEMQERAGEKITEEPTE